MLFYAVAVYLITRTILLLVTEGWLTLGRHEAFVVHVLLIVGCLTSMQTYGWQFDKAMTTAAVAELLYALRVLLDLVMDWCKVHILEVGRRRRPR